MSWGWGENADHRDVGYGVPAMCDQPGCGEEIDRGLSYVCGGMHDGGKVGCGRYLCAGHLVLVGVDPKTNTIVDEDDDEYEFDPTADEETAEVCQACRDGLDPYPPTPDVAEWIEHKLSDESWQPWRDENPVLCQSMREGLPSQVRRPATSGQISSGTCSAVRHR